MSNFFQTDSKISAKGSESGPQTSTGAASTKSSTVNEAYKAKMDKSNLQMDIKADEASRAAILELIENNLNRKYFN